MQESGVNWDKKFEEINVDSIRYHIEKNLNELRNGQSELRSVLEKVHFNLAVANTLLVIVEIAVNYSFKSIVSYIKALKEIFKNLASIRELKKKFNFFILDSFKSGN